MKIFKRREEKIVLSILIAAALSCLAIGIAYSGSLSNENREIRDNGSSIFSPGYINAAKQHTESIIKQTEEKKGFWQRAIESLQDKLAANTAKDADDIVVPELKKKKSGSGENTVKTAEVAQDTPSLPEMLDQETMMSNILNNVISKQGKVTMLDNGSMVTIWYEDDKPYFSVVNGFGETVVEKQFIDPVKDMQYDGNINNIYDMGNGKFLIDMYGANYNSLNTAYDNSSTYEKMTDLRIYDSATGNIEDSQSYLSTQRRYKTNVGYIYEGSVNEISNLTYLGDGSLAMTINSRSYSYQYLNSPIYTSTNYSLRILDNNLYTFKDYTLYNNTANIALPGSVSVRGIASLGNGRFVLATNKIGPISFTVMDKNFNNYGDLSWTSQALTHIISLGNDRFAASGRAGGELIVDTFTLETNGENNYYLNKETSNMLGKGYISSYDENGEKTTSNSIYDMKALDNGSLVMSMRIGGYSYSNATGYYSSYRNASIKLIDDKGDIKDIAIDSAASLGSDITDRDVLSLVTLGNTFGLVLSEYGEIGGVAVPSPPVGDYPQASSGVTAQIFSSENSYSRPYTPDNTSDSSSSKGADNSEDKDKAGNLNLKEAYNMEMQPEAYNPLLKEAADSIGDLKTSLNMNPLAANEALGYGINPNMLASEHLIMKLNTYIMNADALSSYSIFSDTGSGSYARLMASSALLNMLKNPAEGDKNIIDTILAIFNDLSIKNAEGDTILSREDADGLMKAIAATMLAQAIPDLLSGNDLANMKFAFLELSMERSRILKDYDVSTKLYYDEMVKEITSNLGILQLNGIVTEEIAKKDFARMPRNEIDLIVEKIKKEQRKSAETEHIIQQEAKYRKLYIDPNKKIMEDRTKAMIKGFTQKLSNLLENAKPAQK